MNRQSLTFLLVFVFTAIPVALFVQSAQPLYGLVVGLVGLVLHWLLSRGGDRDGEVADSSYFFGFLQTLVFLAVGVYRIGAPVADTGTASTGNILGFLVDLSAGLVLTIAGLLIRQVRTLAAAKADGREEQVLLEAQRELTKSLQSAAELWRARPEHQVLEQLQESRSIARGAAEDLDRTVAAAGARIAASVERLDAATSTATQAMTRAASGVSGSLADVAQRMEVEIEHALTAVRTSVTQTLKRMDAEITSALEAIRQQRVAADEALSATRAAGDAMVAEATTQHRQQLELWRTNLEKVRATLAQTHQHLDEEYRRGMAGFASSGRAFAELAESAAAQVSALPNPAEQLAGLWDGVRRLEADLTEAIGGSVARLQELSGRSAELQSALDRLGGSADTAADRLGDGTKRLAGSLQYELDQMHGVIDSYVELLEKSRRSLKVRA